MNLPNKLTIMRMWMALGMTICLSIPFPFARTLGLIIFIAASITDYFDGKLARGAYGVTTFGKFMDPLADKILVTVALIFLMTPTMDSLLPAWMVIVIISREFMVSGLRMVAAGEGTVIAAGNWGKHKTVWQMVMIAVLMGWLVARYDVFPVLYGEDAATRVAQFEGIASVSAFWMGLAVTGITVMSGMVYLRGCRDIIVRDM